MLLNYIIMLGDPLRDRWAQKYFYWYYDWQRRCSKSIRMHWFWRSEIYNTFVDSKLDKKEVFIQDPISHNKLCLKPKVVRQKKPGKRKVSREGMGDVVRYMNYAIQRGLPEEEWQGPLPWEGGQKWSRVKESEETRTSECPCLPSAPTTTRGNRHWSPNNGNYRLYGVTQKTAS